MASLAEFRKQYPQYDNVPDQQLADSLHQKFYSDMPKAKFYGEIGFSAQAAPAAPPTAPTEGKEELKRGFFRGLINPDMAKKAVQNIKQAGIDYLLTGQNVSDLEQYAAERGGMPVGESEQANVRAVNEAQAPKRAEASKKNLEERAKTQERIEAQTPQYENPIARGAYAGLQSLVQNAPAMAVGIATRNPVVPLASIGTQTGLEQYGNVRQRGGSAHEAALSGLLTGGVEVGTEFLPMGTIVKNFGKTGARKFIAELLAKEIPGEVAATMAQDAIDVAIANPEATWSDYWKSRPEAVSQTIIATIAQAGAMGALSKGVSATKEYLTEKALQGVEAREARLARQEVVEANKDNINEAFNKIVSDYMRHGVPERDAVLRAGIEINDPDRLKELTDVSVAAPIVGGPEPSVPSAGGEAGPALDTTPVADTGSAGLGTPSEPAAGPDVREGQVNAPLVPEMGAPAPTELTATDILHTIEKPAQRRVAAQGMVLGIVQQLAPEANTAMEYTGITADDIKIAATKLVNRGNKFNTPADALLSVVAKKPNIAPDALQTLHTLAAPPLFKQEAMPTPAPAPAPVDLTTPPQLPGMTTPPELPAMAPSPELPAMAPSPELPAMAPPPAPTPQEIAANPIQFAPQAAKDMGRDVPMFVEGVRKIQLDLPTLPNDTIDALSLPELNAYYDGMDWAKDRIADVTNAAFEEQPASAETAPVEEVAPIETALGPDIPYAVYLARTNEDKPLSHGELIDQLDHLETLATQGKLTLSRFKSSEFGQRMDVGVSQELNKAISSDPLGTIQKLRERAEATKPEEAEAPEAEPAFEPAELEQPAFEPAELEPDEGTPVVTPKEIADNLSRFAVEAAVDAKLDKYMFHMGAQEVEAERDAALEGVEHDSYPETWLRTKTIPEVKAYYAGVQWARDRIAEAEALEAEPEAEPVDQGEVENLNQNINDRLQDVADNFMVGDRVRVGNTPGVVIGLDGDYVRVQPDNAKSPKAYTRYPKQNVTLESRPDTSVLTSASKAQDQESKFGEEAGQLNADMAGLIQLLGANMYAANVATVSVKELLQNSFDAVKGAVSAKNAPPLYKFGHIDIVLDSQNRTITLKDDARGMTPEIVRDAFFTVAGSDKSDLAPEERSGGLGLAKMGFMMGADWLTLDTVRDGVRTRVNATSKDIAASNFKVVKSPAPKGEHGTSVTVKVPESYTDPKTGEEKTIWFPYGKSGVDILNQPLIGPVEVTFTHDGDSQTLPMGVNFPEDNYQKLNAKFDWGTADIYYGKERKKWPSHQVLSSGVYQFDQSFKLDKSEVIPYDIIVNVKSAVDAKHPDYPFENSRERFKGRLKEDINSLGMYLTKIARGAEAADLKETMQNIVSLPRIEAGEDLKALEGKLKKTFEKEEVKATPTEKKEVAPAIPKEVTITEKGVFDNTGKTVVDKVKEEEKKKTSSFEAETKAPTMEDYKIVLDQDPKNPIFHNNTNFDPIAVGTPYGDPAKFFAEIGSIFVEMKEFMAKSGRFKYEGLSPENLFYAGVAIDKQYGGLHMKVPYKALLVNPFYEWGARTLAGVRMNLLNTMIHEVAHTGNMEHGVGHNAEMIKTEQYLADEGMLDYFRDAIMDTLLRHESTFTAMKEAYGRSTTQNIAKSLEDISKEKSAGSASGRASSRSSNPTGPVPAGKGRRGRGNLQTPASTGQSGAKLGGSGSTPTPAAKQRAKRVTVLEKKIAASHKATELNNSAAQLLIESRSLKDAIRVLNSTWDALTVGSIRKILVAMDTGDITRWMGDKVANIAVINQGIEDMSLMRNGLIRELAEKVPEWEEFNSTFDEGGRLLGDVMNKTTLKNVDPTLYATAAESIRHDAVIKGLRAQNKRQSDITQRENEIKDVYRDWDKLGTFGKGKVGQKIYKMAKDSYEQTFNMHMAILTNKILASKIPGDPNDPNTSKGRLMASITKSFQEAQQVGVYFPLMRYGKHWVRIGTGTRGEFYMFESAAARNNFVKQRIEEQQAAGDTRTLAKLIEGGDFDVGDTLTDMRTRGGLEKASEMLKDIFDMIDASNLSDVEAVKDQVYQMYLMTLPDKDIRRRFTHRQGKTGFGSDVLRNFIVSQHTAANQLSRLTYADNIRNAIGQAYAETMGDPDKLKLNAVIDEVAIRATTELNPQVADDDVIDWDKLASMANKVVFFFMLTSPKSALVQMTQLHIVGLPVLAARYGATKVAAVAAKHSNLFNTLGLTRRKANGDIITEWGQPSMADGKYIREHKNPTMRDALKYAWNYGNDRNVFMNTYAGDMSERSGAPTAKRATPLGKSSRFVYNFITGGFHHMERISREIMFMSSFELEYERQRKANISHDIAKEAAAKEAMRLTYEALFNFSDYNKPRLLKGKGLARVPVQFMAFPMQFASLLIRNFYQALPLLNKAGKREAAIKFMGIMGMTAMYGGLTALPMYSAMMGLMDGIRELMRPIMDGEDDDPWYDDDDDGTPLGKRSTDRWFREWYLPTYFGPNSNLANSLGLDEEQALKLQRAMEMGFISSYTGLNIGTSTSLDSLFFRGDTSSKDTEEAVEKFLYATAFGPTGGLISSMARGVGKIMSGEGTKGVEMMLPAFLKGPLAATRLAEEGNLTTQGAAVKDAQFYTFGVLMGKALGFENTEVAELQKANMLTKDMIEKVLADKRNVLTRLDRAMQRFDRNPTEANSAEIDKALEAIEKYNYKNGSYPAFTLDQDDIYNSITTRQEGRERAVNGLTVDESLTPLAVDLTQKGRVQE